MVARVKGKFVCHSKAKQSKSVTTLRHISIREYWTQRMIFMVVKMARPMEAFTNISEYAFSSLPANMT